MGSSHPVIQVSHLNLQFYRHLRENQTRQRVDDFTLKTYAYDLEVQHALHPARMRETSQSVTRLTRRMGWGFPLRSRRRADLGIRNDPGVLLFREAVV